MEIGHKERGYGNCSKQNEKNVTKSHRTVWNHTNGKYEKTCLENEVKYEPEKNVHKRNLA